VDLIDKHEGH